MATARAAAAVVAGSALAGASAGPATALRLLTQPSADDPTSALVGALGLTAWVIAVWVLLAAAATAGAHLPGRLGRAAAHLSRRIAPTAVRRLVEVALGLTVSTAVLGVSPAAAVVSLDRGGQVDTAVPALDWGAATSPAPAPAPAAPQVVVAPGDSLWSLAERELEGRSGAAPSDAAIAQAWPSWWAANREAVGPDPDLLLPGTSLTPPAQP